jgi:membrane protein implicated in regulation of membrane protease activity
MTWIQWLIIAGVLFIGEIVTPGFILLWFGVGAAISSLLALYFNLYVQVIAFIIISTGLIVFTRPIMKRLVKQKDVFSNVYAMSGKKGIVVQDINNLLGKGQVKISGEVWQARAEQDSEIPKNTEV